MNERGEETNSGTGPDKREDPVLEIEEEEEIEEEDKEEEEEEEEDNNDDEADDAC